MATTAKPLKIPSTTPGKASSSTTPTADNPGSAPSRSPNAQGPAGASDITSPHELTAFVETLLEKLDAKFDDMSSQVLERMEQMSTRVDALEASIQDIINGDISGGVPSGPQSPPGTPGGLLTPGQGMRRTGST